ncbi:hypothetical protein CYMTET_4435 [Cymbomonas tetramitiformis]|uniref:DNA helicase n=1 Tax=Cymbomonas tetramitiformis TaxID=36881 RepID=A0AAE0H2Y3_9CHLO|nr:hypothetical protein CYMTET_4435 [Cymbomonas tetramitiformis]
MNLNDTDVENLPHFVSDKLHESVDKASEGNVEPKTRSYLRFLRPPDAGDRPGKCKTSNTGKSRDQEKERAASGITSEGLELSDLDVVKALRKAGLPGGVRVNDCRVFDEAGVRYRGRHLQKAPKWALRGVEAYEHMHAEGHVFFLEKVERIDTVGLDDVGIEQCEWFRAFQLRVRDGVATHDDYNRLKALMFANGATEATINHDSDVYRLVTTRAPRDEKNAEALKRHINCGAPFINIQSLNSSKVAEEADKEDMRLPHDLPMCIGARMMITWNLCIAHNLVNGTVGLVHDIICNAQGLAVAVLLLVKKRTPSQDGYSGPSFLERVEGVDMDKYAVVAIGRKVSQIYDGGVMHERQQFPLMLAWAVTIHKAQGLTLNRVVIDVGDDERSVGLLFVALTRVRRPTHLAFHPFPDECRITTTISRKPAYLPAQSANNTRFVYGTCQCAPRGACHISAHHPRLSFCQST